MLKKCSIIFQKIYTYIKVKFQNKESIVEKEEILYSKDQWELFVQLQKGDLVWALMPLSKEKLGKIPEGHRIRPYLIMKKTDKKLYGYPSSTTMRMKKRYLEYPIDYYKYNKNKLGRISLKTLYEIPIENLRCYFGTMTKNDKRNIDHRLFISSCHGIKVPYYFYDMVYLKEGDIISFGKTNYYIMSCSNDKIVGVPIYRSVVEEQLRKINIDGHKYYIDFNDLKELEIKKINYRILEMTTYKEKARIENLYKEFKQRQKTSKFIKYSNNKEVRTEVLKRYGIYESECGGKYLYLYSDNGVHYGVDYFGVSENMTLKKINKHWKLIDECCENEVYDILEKLVCSDSVDDSHLDKLMEVY